MVNKQKPVTKEMVAAQAGVSKTTVSFVLNNNPSISEATRKKVLQIVDQLGYQPNTNARNLSSKKTRTICIVLPELGHIFEDPYFARAIGGVYDEVEAADYRLILKKASFEFAKDKEYLNLFRRKEIAGMLYVGSTLDDQYLAEFVDTGFPFILVNSYLPGINIPFVISDNVTAAYVATHHLIELGHTRIGHIAGSRNTTTAIDRIAGYRKALEEAGIGFDPDFIAEGHYNKNMASAATRRLFELSERPTAIFAGNDMMALGVLDAASTLGLRVPEDCALVGGDNIEISQFTNPPLTTIDQPIYEVSRTAIRTLFELISGEILPSEARKMTPTQLIVRKSCGAKSGVENGKRVGAAGAK
ncbi:MAG: LacI family DNA-binding transcriptional regulator [Candidatus Hydrogenedentota bacterium]